jgi:hypothetical protein
MKQKRGYKHMLKTGRLDLRLATGRQEKLSASFANYSEELLPKRKSDWNWTPRGGFDP